MIKKACNKNVSSQIECGVLTLRDESFSDLPGEDGGVFPFVLLDFGDDGGGGDLGLAAPDEARGPERPGDTCGAHKAN